MSIDHPRVGFVTALEMECRWLGDSTDIEVVVGGMGRQRAEHAARQLVARGIVGLVSWGFAGGVDPELAAGDVVLADKVLGSDGTVFCSDEPWRRRLEMRVAGRVPTAGGLLVHTDEVVGSVEGKRALRQRWGASIVDMESIAIARVADQAGLPWLSVRVVSDTATQTLPDGIAESGGDDGRLRPGRVARFVLSPWLWPDLIRLARSTAVAARSMRELCRIAGPDLAAVDDGGR